MELLRTIGVCVMLLVAAYIVVRVLGYAACRSFFDARRKEEQQGD